jgi:hypothetical protein
MRLPIITSAINMLLLVTPLSDARGADFEFHPSLTVTEEYDDNIFLDAEDEEEEYTTVLGPAVSLKYESAFWTWDVDSSFDYVIYAKNSRNDEWIYDVHVQSQMRMIQDLFFVDIRNELSRVSVDKTRDFTDESRFVDQSDRNIFTANPYFVLRLSPRVQMTPGYTYRNIWYDEDVGSDKEEHSGYVDTSVDVTPKTSSTAKYTYIHQENDDADDFDRHTGDFGVVYAYAEESNISLTVGYTWIDFEGGNDTTEIVWKGSATYGSPALTSEVLFTRDYRDDPEGNIFKEDLYRISFLKNLNRTSLSVSGSVTEYSDGETDDLETRTFESNAAIAHEITSQLTGSLRGSFAYLDEKLGAADIRRYLASARVTYAFGKYVSSGIGYEYSHSDSDDVLDKYENNRVSIWLSGAL